MANFGESHRQVVEQTNSGQIAPVPQIRGSAEGNLQADKQIYVGRETGQVATALLQVADAAAKPIIAERNRKRELQGYIDAGTEEGRKAADTAAGAWHNKLFGPDASLRGAQTRIAETAADDIYIKANDELINGDAASWDDEKWEEWREKNINAEIDKYDDEDMRNHVTSVLGKNLQKLERDRAWKHREWLQVEENKALTEHLNQKAKLNEIDRKSPNPQQSQEDAYNASDEITKALESSGVSPRAKASIVAKVAAQRLQLGDSSFYETVQEAGHLQELDYESKNLLAQSLRVHEIKTDERILELQHDLEGPGGAIQTGNEQKAVQILNELRETHPEAVPDFNNTVRQVRGRAWSIARNRRIEAEWQQRLQHAITSGTPANMRIANPDGTVTWRTANAAEMTQAVQQHLNSHRVSQHHAEWLQKNDGTPYVPMTEAENRARAAEPENLAYAVQIMGRTGVEVPFLTDIYSNAVETMQYDLAQGKMDPESAQELIDTVASFHRILSLNPTAKGVMSEALGENTSALIDTVMKWHNQGTEADKIGKKLMQLNSETASGKVSLEDGKLVSKASGEAGALYARVDDIPRDHRANWLARRTDYNLVVDAMKAGKEGVWNIRHEQEEVIRSELALETAKALAEKGVTGEPTRMQMQLARSTAVGRINKDWGLIYTSQGWTPVKGAYRADEAAKAAGFDGGINQFIELLAGNDDYVNMLEKYLDAPLAKRGFGNRLTDGPVSFNFIEDEFIMLEVAKPEGGTSIATIEIPREDKPHTYNPKVQQDLKVSNLLQKHVTNDEQWKELTGEKQGLIAQYQAEIIEKIAEEKFRDDPDAYAGMNSKEIESTVTQEDIHNFIPPEEYKHGFYIFSDTKVQEVTQNMRKDADWEYDLSNGLSGKMGIDSIYHAGKNLWNADNKVERIGDTAERIGTNLRELVTSPFTWLTESSREEPKRTHSTNYNPEDYVLQGKDISELQEQDAKDEFARQQERLKERAEIIEAKRIDSGM